MTFLKIAEPDNELKLHNCVNKRLLHIHYIEKKVQYMIKNNKIFNKIAWNHFLSW